MNVCQTNSGVVIREKPRFTTPVIVNPTSRVGSMRIPTVQLAHLARVDSDPTVRILCKRMIPLLPFGEHLVVAVVDANASPDVVIVNKKK